MRRRMNRSAWTLAAMFFLMGYAPSGAEERAPRASFEDGALDVPLLDEPGAANVPIDIRADKLGYDPSTGWAHGEGSLVVSRGDEAIAAERGRVNMRTGEVVIDGPWSHTKGGEVRQGTDLVYNFHSRDLAVEEFSMVAPPFTLTADKFEKDAEGRYTLEGATMTTCAYPVGERHYYVTASRLRVRPGHSIIIYDGIWRFGAIPVMYLPIWYQNLDRESGFHFIPGYDSRMGAFLLTEYRHRLSETLRSRTHLDYRSNRGVAGGQTFLWHEPVERSWSGRLTAYYADDQDPMDRDDTATIESERYRLLFEHQSALSERDAFRARLNYLSDTDVLEDFFEDEFRRANQPENFAAVTRGGENYVASLGVQGRLNDFYSGVNRAPEFRFDVFRTPIGDSGLFYESQSQASFLDRVWAEGSDREDVSATRLDTRHMFYYPDKYFGFLTLVPRGGGRATYYSKTLGEPIAVTEVVPGVGGTNEVVTRQIGFEDGGSDTRALFELGTEASFKAFRVFTDEHAQPWLRHVAEPYIDYTILTEPTVLPERLHAFDAIDRIDEQHFIGFGMRNLLQTRSGERTYDLLDLDVGSRFILDAEEGEEEFGDVFVDSKLRPRGLFEFDLRSRYDTAGNEVAAVDAEARYGKLSEGWRIETEYRYRAPDVSLLTGGLDLAMMREWALNLYSRYDLEDSRFQEHGFRLTRTVDCIAWQLGFTHIPAFTLATGLEREDEWKVMFAFWLTHFPDFGIQSGRYRR